LLLHLSLVSSALLAQKGAEQRRIHIVNHVFPSPCWSAAFTFSAPLLDTNKSPSALFLAGNLVPHPPTKACKRPPRKTTTTIDTKKLRPLSAP
jgi:hypothetical protein